ncbi:sigma-70 family RNA polymerase sigma factor [Roseivivax isoporae]|uniref:RNA polymerase sigma 70 n=1 Tax=Roseivivax isoporae LMG 25204 TaxID=1449351 RepID=X7F7H2_9RHOB|nr:sigma-70 family RNA polymerase sigma factor [Roseivivax isoporae]ETX28882.1 hypothetical protein RISW2_04005 [Roseivivax isoporae LMG 25204]
MFTTFGAALRQPLLDHESERDAIRRWQTARDRAALEILLRSHARQVWSLARRWTDNPAHLEDLVAEGMIGLMRAAGQFDLDRDVRFATYAKWCVRSELAAARARLAGVGEASAGDAAGMRDVPLPHVQGQLALDTASEDGLSALDRLPSEALSPEEEVLQRSSEQAWRQVLDAALSELDDMEAEIVQRRRLQVVPEPLADMARDLGLTVVRLRQIETRALNRLRHLLMARGFCMSLLH